MTRERWRNIPGWPGYKVSSNGRVKSVDRVLSDGRLCGGAMLKGAPDKDDYLYVSLCDGPRRRRIAVHVLVLEAFTGPRPDGQEARHGPGGRQDNRTVNLRWGTHRENEQDKWKTEHWKQREASPPETPITPVTLAEAVSSQVISGNLPGARMCRHRDPDFPKPAGRRSTAK